MAGRPDGGPARLRLIVGGRVQGVGFRYFVRERGRELGLAGWVRNRPDGAVELEVEGPADGVERLRRLVAKGPEGARVERVEVQDGAGTEPLPHPFIILR